MTPSVPSMPVVEWQCARLAQLTPLALLRILRARQAVFVVEQACVYLDADEADEQAWHLTAWGPGQTALAGARLVDPGVKYAAASIGRVFTAPAARGTGLGRALVQRAVEATVGLHPAAGIRISAQSHLERFYAGFGFVVDGQRHLEDGIEHTEMWRPPHSA